MVLSRRPAREFPSSHTEIYALGKFAQLPPSPNGIRVQHCALPNRSLRILSRRTSVPATDELILPLCGFSASIWHVSLAEGYPQLRILHY